MSIRNSFLLLPILGAFTVSCASSPPSQNVAAPAGNGPNVIYLKEGDRVPAQSPTLAWVPTVVTLNVSGADSNANIDVAVNQEMSWTERESFEDTRFEYREVEAPGTCYEYTCRGGTGKSELWNAFYSAPRAQKPAALARAIKGIGQPSAEALVNSGYFGSKPRSWQDFAAEIKRAGDRGVIQKSAATAVTSTYRAENLVNLGYAADSCSERAYACTVWVDRLMPVRFTNYRDVVRRKIVATRLYKVTALVSNARLLSTERETVSFRVDENGAVLESEVSSTYNRYAVVTTPAGTGNVRVALTGVQRFLRDLSANVVRKDSFETVNGTPTFTLDIDASFVPNQEDPNSQLVLDYKLMGCKTILGICRAHQTLKTESKPLSQSRTAFAVDIPDGLKTWIEYTVARRNSAYFNDKPTPSRETSTVRR